MKTLIRRIGVLAENGGVYLPDKIGYFRASSSFLWRILCKADDSYV
jgi:hypothetical protein